MKLIFLFIFIFLFNSSEEAKIRWAFELFRHGARSPYGGMTSDFKDCFGAQWNGLKELTGVGLRQHFLVGHRNRIRYINEHKLLSENYDPREVYLISTDSNRTIMSANAQVQGLYPPGTGPQLFANQSEVAIPPVEASSYQKAKEDLDKDGYAVLPNRINIIPVHSFFNDDHFIQLQDKRVCPNNKEHYKQNEERKEVTDFLAAMDAKYGEKLYQILYNKDEKDKNPLKNYGKAYYIFDTVITQYTEGYDKFEEVAHNLNVTQEELLKDAFDFFFLDLVGNGIDNDICIHAMSPIVDRIIQLMKAKIKKDQDKEENYIGYDLPKFVMFSAHDSTCGAFIGYMKAVFGAEGRYPYFATNINLELIREDKEGGNYTEDDYKVEYLVNDESLGVYDYKYFVQKAKENFKSKEDLTKFCGWKEKDDEDDKKDDDKKDDKKEEGDNSRNTVFIIVNIVLGIICFVLIGLIVVTILMKKSKEDMNNIESIEKLNSMSGENEANETS